MMRKNTYAAIGCAVLSALATSCLTAPPAAQSYPNRAVRVIVPSSPASAIDVTASVVSAKLTELWGQPVIIDNRPGGSMIIGATATSKARPMDTRCWSRMMEPWR